MDDGRKSVTPTQNRSHWLPAIPTKLSTVAVQGHSLPFVNTSDANPTRSAKGEFPILMEDYSYYGNQQVFSSTDRCVTSGWQILGGNLCKQWLF